MTDIDSQILSDACFDGYAVIALEIMGISLKKTRKLMLAGRIRKRIKELDFKNYEVYLEYLKRNRNEESHFIDLITTNETYFFRTPKIWDFIANEFLPDWYQRNNGKKLNIWSAASSTGEEAYTLGIICQAFKISNPGFQYRILGTDISPAVVARATEGRYIGRPIEKFLKTKPELFRTYMIGDDEKGYQVTPDIRSNIAFKTHNLFNCFNSKEKFHLILLRNVLIYFSKENQQKVLANIKPCLSNDGYLIIGESESLSQLKVDFGTVASLIYKPLETTKSFRPPEYA